MQYAMRVQIVECRKQLVRQPSGTILCDAFLAAQQLVQVTGRVLRNDDYLIVRLERMQDLNDVRVGQVMLDFAFAAKVFNLLVSASTLNGIAVKKIGIFEY